MTHPASKKPCVNCTCATTGFCPRGVGANIPPGMAAASPQAEPARPQSANQLRRAQLAQLPGKRKAMRY
ncbi:hypothetical protein [Zoogloea dura]|uniref:Uncharacterized protein n=1 Tax=Zoogloea dura TaxID=2728840 RepID=A0A848G3G8_9RHOO|nr:hypothetical protein [Zoogloea dura]NML25680.1 hypothetical protein [Zoogloea dura]